MDLGGAETKTLIRNCSIASYSSSCIGSTFFSQLPGIYNNGCSPKIHGCYLTGDSAGISCFNDATPEINQNRIQVATLSHRQLKSRLSGIEVSQNARPLIVNNFITGANSGIYVFNGGGGVIR